MCFGSSPKSHRFGRLCRCFGCLETQVFNMVGDLRSTLGGGGCVVVEQEFRQGARGLGVVLLFLFLWIDGCGLAASAVEWCDGCVCGCLWGWGGLLLHGTQVLEHAWLERERQGSIYTPQAAAVNTLNVPAIEDIDWRGRERQGSIFITTAASTAVTLTLIKIRLIQKRSKFLRVSIRYRRVTKND